MICPKCQHKMMKSGGPDGNPYHQNNPEVYTCPSCGYEVQINEPLTVNLEVNELNKPRTLHPNKRPVYILMVSGRKKRDGKWEEATTQERITMITQWIDFSGCSYPLDEIVDFSISFPIIIINKQKYTCKLDEELAITINDIELKIKVGLEKE